MSAISNELELPPEATPTNAACRYCGRTHAYIEPGLPLLSGVFNKEEKVDESYLVCLIERTRNATA